MQFLSTKPHIYHKFSSNLRKFTGIFDIRVFKAIKIQRLVQLIFYINFIKSGGFSKIKDNILPI